MKTYLIVIPTLACGVPLFAQGASGDHVQGRLIAQLRSDADASAVDRALSANGAARHHILTQINTHVLDVPEEALDRVQSALIKTGLFTFVERDGVAHGGLTPNDPYFSSQW